MVYASHCFLRYHMTFHTVIALVVWGLSQEVAEWLEAFEQSVEAAMHGLAYSVTPRLGVITDAHAVQWVCGDS